MSSLIRDFKGERLGSNYIYFRSPIELVLIAIPSIVALSINILESPRQSLEPYRESMIIQLQVADINTFLIQVEMLTIILLSFFLCHKWTEIKSNGTYSFWLIHGVIRSKFFIYSIFKFILLIYFGQILGVISLFYLNQYILPVEQIILLSLGLLFHIVLIVSIAILLSELITIPEVSALSYMFIMAIVILTITDMNTIHHQILRSNLHYQDITTVIYTIFSGLLAIGILTIAMMLHMRSDLET